MAYCYDSFGRSYYCSGSNWYNWGRWVVLGVIVLAFFLVFFLFSCISARRRRKLGRRPMYGTGWAAPGAHGQATYNPNYSQQPPQGYNNYNQTQPQGGYYGQNQGYFGGQQTGVEMPSNTYQPPAGPPPNKY